MWDEPGRDLFLETGTPSPDGRCGKSNVIGFLAVPKDPRCEHYERRASGTVCHVDLATTNHLGRQFGQPSAPFMCTCMTTVGPKGSLNGGTAVNVLSELSCDTVAGMILRAPPICGLRLVHQ